MLVLGADVFRYALERANKRVGLLAVAAVEYLSLEVGFVSFESCGRLTLWSVARTTTSTATLS